MATANFYVKNAKSYYVFSGVGEYENENGEMEERYREGWEFDMIMEDIRNYGEYSGMFPSSSDRWDSYLDARELCTSENYHNFGNGKCYLLQTTINSSIYMRSGHYEGAVLDYDVQLESYYGDTCDLSVCGDIDTMVEHFTDTLRDIIDWSGDICGWNKGTFKLQEKNIRKWLKALLEKEVEKCEKFCKQSCEMELCVSERFSNGETWYTRVG